MRIDEIARDDHRPLRLDGLHVAIVHPHGTHMAAEGRIRQPRGGRMLGSAPVAALNSPVPGLSGRSGTGVCTST